MEDIATTAHEFIRRDGGLPEVFRFDHAWVVRSNMSIVVVDTKELSVKPPKLTRMPLWLLPSPGTYTSELPVGKEVVVFSV